MDDLVVTSEPSTAATKGTIVVLKVGWAEAPDPAAKYTYEWKIGGQLVSPAEEVLGEPNVALLADGSGEPTTIFWNTKHAPENVYKITVNAQDSSGNQVARGEHHLIIQPQGVALPTGDRVRVAMQRAETPDTADEVLWAAIRAGTERLSFQSYADFIERVMCGRTAPSRDESGSLTELKGRDKDRFLPFSGVGAYELLKVATEVFLMCECAVGTRGIRGSSAGVTAAEWDRYTVDPDIATDGKLELIPYLALIRTKLRDVPLASESGRYDYDEEARATLCRGILTRKLRCPCFLELIWSYWHEEGMLVQTMNAISLRFQNRRNPNGRDPLAAFEIDPLRPLNNLLWGYIQDEQHRLTVPRRNYEYDHHYGLRLRGKAIPADASADSRTKFMEAFHDLLRRCTAFFRQDDETTVIADGFPVLNALKEVHLILSEGAHNQYGDLPWTARQEMLMQEWVLARPEMREFLPTRIMVAYPEPWMDRVDAMKKLQGWTDNSVLHYRNLGVFGEQILLSVRFGAWSDVRNRDQAANWARAWRAEIQGYGHAYQAVTGLDLSRGAYDTATPIRLARAARA